MRVLSSFAVIAMAAASQSLAGCAYSTAEDRPVEDIPVNEHVGESQAALCSGSCDNQDPHTTGCDTDRSSVASTLIKNNFGVTMGAITVYWSQNCSSAWAETTSLSNNYLVARITRVSPSASYFGNNALTGPGTVVHSPMVAVTTGTTVTGKGDVEPVAGGDYFATASHTF